MIDSLLIANRGEIASRIMRTSRRLGIQTIAVYSETDADMPFVREADKSICIGPAAITESYLRQDRILAAASISGAQAIHPGYGFLSENAEFAEAVIVGGFVWVGANPSAIRAMGLKDEAKQRMAAAGVPVTPGYLGEDQNPDRLHQEADRLGYPLLIKAVAGGGGKGMRLVRSAADFSAALESCRREAATVFGNDRVLIERYIASPRHIEVQIFGDAHGAVVHLFERDCSLQRRHQKVIEEAPAPGMSARTREAVCEIAVRAARSVDYLGAGTVEFIADGSKGLHADQIWFMEMNTRLQVEHGVTEAISGQDLVEWQLKVASGEPLPLSQQDLSINGWAMEARLYAEKPSTGFLPSTGRLQHLRLPTNVRVDSGVEEGNEISPFYDPMIAKLISHGRTRAEAASKLADAVASVEVWPVATNAGFLVRTLSHPDFVDGEVDTGFIDRHAAALIPPEEPDRNVQALAAAALLDQDRQHPWSALRGFRMNSESARRIRVEIAGQRYVAELCDETARGRVVGDVLFLNGQGWQFAQPRPGSAHGSSPEASGTIMAPMPGRVVAVHVSAGQSVKIGQPLLVLEAMKMEQTLKSPRDGVIADIRVKLGSHVTEGSLLLRIERTDHGRTPL